jgi:hypothetical protein
MAQAVTPLGCTQKCPVQISSGTPTISTDFFRRFFHFLLKTRDITLVQQTVTFPIVLNSLLTVIQLFNAV